MTTHQAAAWPPRRPAVTRAQTPLIVLFAPLLASLLLIATGAILEPPTSTTRSSTFVSSPVIALLIGLIGTSFVGRYAFGAEPIQHAIATGFKESGQILILTGVGGSLAATIKAAGLGDILGEYFTASTAAPLLVVWAIAAVAAHRGRLGHHLGHHLCRHPGTRRAGHRPRPVLIALAAGAGSLFAVHVTSNTFWLLQSLLGQTDARRAEDRHGRCLGRLRRRDPAHPADERPVLIQLYHERRPSMTRQQRHSPTRRGAGPGTRQLHRRPHGRPDARRLRRRGHQGRAAGHRRRTAQLAALLGRHLDAVPDHQPQQEVHRARPEDTTGPGRSCSTSSALRRPAGELPARHAGEVGAGARGPQRGQPGPHHHPHLRVRPDRAAVAAPRLRRRRRGVRRPARTGRRPRPAAGARRRLHRRLDRRHLRRVRHHDGAVPARAHESAPRAADHRRRAQRGQCCR